MKLKKIKTVSVLEFVPLRPLMLVKRSIDLQYIDTPDCSGAYFVGEGALKPSLNFLWQKYFFIATCKWREITTSLHVDGWAGACNLHPYPPHPTPTHTHCQSWLQHKKCVFTHFTTRLSRTDGRTDGQTNRHLWLLDAFATEKIQDCHTEVRWRRLQLKVLLATGCPWNKTKCF